MHICEFWWGRDNSSSWFKLTSSLNSLIITERLCRIFLCSKYSIIIISASSAGFTSTFTVPADPPDYYLVFSQQEFPFQFLQLLCSALKTLLPLGLKTLLLTGLKTLTDIWLEDSLLFSASDRDSSSSLKSSFSFGGRSYFCLFAFTAMERHKVSISSGLMTAKSSWAVGIKGLKNSLAAWLCFSEWFSSAPFQWNLAVEEIMR